MANCFKKKCPPALKQLSKGQVYLVLTIEAEKGLASNPFTSGGRTVPPPATLLLAQCRLELREVEIWYRKKKFLFSIVAYFFY